MDREISCAVPCGKLHGYGAWRPVRSAPVQESYRARRLRMQLRFSLVSMFAVACLAACGGKAKGTEPATSTAMSESLSLYDRLGRRDAIVLVVKDFVEQRVAKDARINGMFANTDIPDL